jgi:AraC-like DNA-binding protein
LKTQSFSTDAVPPKKRLKYWRQLIGKIFARFEFTCDDIPEDEFYASVTNCSTDRLEIYDIRGSAHTVRFSQDSAAFDQYPAICITLLIEGKGSFTQDGRSSSTNAKDLQLLDMSRPFEIRFDGPMRQFVLMIPRDIVQTHLIAPRRVTGKGISGDTGIGSVASEFLNAFFQNVGTMEEAEVQTLTRSLIDILNAAVLAQLTPAAKSKSNYQDFSTHQIRLYIEDQLRDPELSPALIAAAHGISQRYLNKLFESEGIPVSRLIWERRLENCRHDLENPNLSGKSITEIAYSWGFASAAHFSRSFKERYGATPRQTRVAAQSH